LKAVDSCTYQQEGRQNRPLYLWSHVTLPNTYKMLTSILLSRLTPYAEEIIGDHQGGFGRNRSTADHILCICQILEKRWEYKEAVRQLFIDF